jgi:alpha-beta hydrolase superfamily lysophospholipase
MKKFDLKAFDGADIGVDLWDEVAAPKACVQISHGMAEHPDRYDDFAGFLNSKGYIVAAEDHRGHRRGAVNGQRGMVYGDSWNETLDDMDKLCDYLKDTYGLPVILLGHSYGSFLSQCYVERHSDKLAGCILSGTAYMKNALIGAGLTIAAIQKAFCGGQKMGNFINKLSFGAYNKPFEEQGQSFAWLSRDKEQVAKYEADPECGYVLCIDYYYYFFKGAMKMYGKDARNIRKDFKILVACGGCDPVSNKSKQARQLVEFYRNLGLSPSLKVYEGARHEILNEINKEEVYNDFALFIESAVGQEKKQ